MPRKGRQIIRLSGDRDKLARLAVEINHHASASERYFQSAVQEAIMAGEKLIEAKSLVKHGEWLPWLDANFISTRRTASTYMRLAKAPRKQMGSASSIREAVALLTEHVQSSQPDQDASDDDTAPDERSWNEFLSDWETTKPQRSDYPDDKDGEIAINQFRYLVDAVEHHRSYEIACYRRWIAAMSAELANDLSADDTAFAVAVLTMAATGIEFQQADLTASHASENDYDGLYETARLAWLRHRQAKDVYNALVGKPPMDEQVPMNFYDAFYILLPELRDDAEAVADN